MRARRPLALLLAAPLVVPLGLSGPATSAAPACTSDVTPTFAGDVPTLRDVLGFDFGQVQVTTPQIATYLAAVDAASDDVSTGVFATSASGTPMRYAVVGDPEDVAAAQAASARLRDPDTTPSQARRIAKAAPAIVWMAGNVHGNEESGADAALQVLHSLADGTDCAATAIRTHTVTVVIPTQNPDGRDLNQRRNTYGFDLNRDWFARTQSETDGKLSLLMKYPPVLLSDNHEKGGTDFFFPPNADPIHHEIADRSIGWINDLYGGAMAAAFQRKGWDYFNYNLYDLLFMGYGDTVPTTALLGAGMTYEKGNASPIAERTEQHFGATWASMLALANSKTSVLEGLAANYRQARGEGRRGELEPNAVFAPGSVLKRQVPDETVRSYFIRDTASKRTEVRSLVRRLQRMEVEVRRLSRPLVVPDYRPYGTGPRRVVLPAGTWYVPMAQAQKHWVQAMLGEDSYVPFPYFYDVTAWSLPLLFNVPAGRSGARLSPTSRAVSTLPATGVPRLPRPTPAVGLWLTDDSTEAYESEGWARWLFDKKWRLPYRKVTTSGISEGALAPLKVLVVPNGDAAATEEALGPQGRAALRDWVAKGGRFVGFGGGTELAARLQLTTAQLREATSEVPGSLIRVDVRRGSLAKGVGARAWNFYDSGNQVMTLARPGQAAVRYPSGSDFFVSGYQKGAEELKGTAAVVAERYARGRVVLFAGDPNFRAYTDGTQKILYNAMLGGDPAPGAADVRSRSADLARSAALARTLRPLDGRARLTVRAGSVKIVADRLRAAGTTVRVDALGNGLARLSWRVPDEDGRSELATVLRRLGPAREKVLTARVP